MSDVARLRSAVSRSETQVSAKTDADDARVLCSGHTNPTFEHNAPSAEPTRTSATRVAVGYAGPDEVGSRRSRIRRRHAPIVGTAIGVRRKVEALDGTSSRRADVFGDDTTQLALCVRREGLGPRSQRAGYRHTAGRCGDAVEQDELRTCMAIPRRSSTSVSPRTLTYDADALISQTEDDRHAKRGARRGTRDRADRDGWTVSERPRTQIRPRRARAGSHGVRGSTAVAKHLVVELRRDRRRSDRRRPGSSTARSPPVTRRRRCGFTRTRAGGSGLKGVDERRREACVPSRNVLRRRATDGSSPAYHAVDATGTAIDTLAGRPRVLRRSSSSRRRPPDVVGDTLLHPLLGFLLGD